MKIKKIKSKQRSSGKYIQHDGNIYKMHNKFGRKNMNDDKRYKNQPKTILFCGKRGVIPYIKKAKHTTAMQ